MMDTPTTPVTPETTVPPAQTSTPTQDALEKARTSRSLIVFLLLVLPPVAWILMWRDKTYHHWFIKFLIVSGIITLFSLGSVYVTLTTNMDAFYASIGIPNTNKELLYWTNVMGIVFAITQILYAGYLHYYFKKHAFLHPWQLFLTLFFLYFNLYATFLGPLLTLQAVSAFYLSVI